jgi:hypothetical protein
MPISRSMKEVADSPIDSTLTVPHPELCRGDTYEGFRCVSEAQLLLMLSVRAFLFR